MPVRHNCVTLCPTALLSIPRRFFLTAILANRPLLPRPDNTRSVHVVPEIPHASLLGLDAQLACEREEFLQGLGRGGNVPRLNEGEAEFSVML